MQNTQGPQFVIFPTLFPVLPILNEWLDKLLYSKHSWKATETVF